MRVRPIIFSTPMVQALLDGRKTQTRRIVKPQPPSVEDVRSLCGAEYSWIPPNHNFPYWRVSGDVWAVRKLMGDTRGYGEPVLVCPYGQPGDLLWVRETYRHIELPPHQWDEVGECEIDYRATPRKIFEGCEVPWRPSIHMPRRDSRLTLRITDVRVERVQEISEADAKAEGAPFELREIDSVRLGAVATHRAGFERIFKHLYGPGLWHLNPFVWVIAFDVIQANVDAYLRRKSAA